MIVSNTQASSCTTPTGRLWRHETITPDGIRLSGVAGAGRVRAYVAWARTTQGIALAIFWREVLQNPIVVKLDFGIIFLTDHARRVVFGRHGDSNKYTNMFLVGSVLFNLRNGAHQLHASDFQVGNIS